MQVLLMQMTSMTRRAKMIKIMPGLISQQGKDTRCCDTNKDIHHEAMTVKLIFFLLIPLVLLVQVGCTEWYNARCPVQSE